jgi:choline-sulfatase
MVSNLVINWENIFMSKLNVVKFGDRVYLKHESGKYLVNADRGGYNWPQLSNSGKVELQLVGGQGEVTSTSYIKIKTTEEVTGQNNILGAFGDSQDCYYWQDGYDDGKQGWSITKADGGAGPIVYGDRVYITNISYSNQRLAADSKNQGYITTVINASDSWILESVKSLPQKPNIVILLTDQDSAGVVEHWPKEFEQKYLPATTRLKKHGLTFNRMFIASAACSPSRASLLTSTYPDEHGVAHTMAAPSTEDRTGGSPPIGYSQNALRPSQLNLAHMLKAAGYKVVWKGKWHLSHAVNGTDTWTEDDVTHMERAYGFYSWNPGDAGYSKGNPKKFAFSNDARYVDATEYPEFAPKGTGAIEFIQQYKPEDGPFCLIVSLVNPHDIHVAPFFSKRKGYTEEEVRAFGEQIKPIQLPVPQNADEDLSMKPEVQELWKQTQKAVGDRTASEPGSKPKTYIDPEVRQIYVDFYAYLKTKVDAQMNRVLDALEQKGLTDNTVIVRLADHGEMCLAHGLREKAYNTYEETIRIPLIVSNPQLFPEPLETNTLASSIDILPTLAKIAGVYDIFKFAFRGCDLTPVFENPQTGVVKEPDGTERDYIHFSFDDGFLPDRFKFIPMRIRSIRTKDWKYSVYFNNEGSKYEYELYDLKKDPHENNNLAGVSRYWEQQKTLHKKLATIMREKGTVPDPYWIYTEAMQEDKQFVPPLYWPTEEEAVLAAKMQYEGNIVQQKYRRSELIQNKVKQVPVDMWWVY